MKNKITSIADQLFYLSYNNTIPLYSVIEVTYKCNLNCKHCYIPYNWRWLGELSTEEIKKVIYDLYTLGGMYIVFSGGEPLLRKDIFELIEFSKKLNFIVILFSNGSLINKKVVDKLKKVNIDRVEISIYGDKPAHNNFVGANVFSKVIDAIKLLKKYDIDVCIKTTLTNENYDEYDFIKNLASQFKINLKTDVAISAKLNHDRSNLSLVLDDNKIKKYFITTQVLKRKINKKNIASYLSCSAGFNIVSVSPIGNVYPCVQLPYYIGNIRQKSFKEIWIKDFQQYRKKVKQNSNYNKCFNCEKLSFCNRCPGMCYVETRNLFGCSYVVNKIAEVCMNT